MMQEHKLCTHLSLSVVSYWDRIQTISEKQEVAQRDQDMILNILDITFPILCVSWVPEILLPVCIFSYSDGDFLIQCFSISQAWNTHTHKQTNNNAFAHTFEEVTPMHLLMHPYTKTHTMKKRSWCQTIATMGRWLHETN